MGRSLFSDLYCITSWEIFRRQFFSQKMDYILKNPVWAGLVGREEAWQYSSATDFHGFPGG